MAELELSVLEPPYAEPFPPLGREPVLGSIAIGRITAARELTPHLAALLERAPWVMPSVVLAPTLVSPAVLQGVWALPGQPAFLVTTVPGERVTGYGIVEAITRRPPPPASLLVAYIVRRTRSVVLGETIDQAWGERHQPTNADRTVRHRLRQLGNYSRHDWIRIRRLIRAKTEGHGLPVEQLAQSVGTEARTFRSWVRRYLGASMKTFQTTAGWEWILEAALRRGGFGLDGAPRRNRAVPEAEAIPAGV